MNGATRFPLSLRFVLRNYSQGNGLGRSAGKEDPVELDFSMCEGQPGVAKRGGGAAMPGCARPLPRTCGSFPRALGSGSAGPWAVGDAYGEFGWGGTTVISEHRRPKVGSAGKETSPGA